MADTASCSDEVETAFILVDEVLVAVFDVLLGEQAVPFFSPLGEAVLPLLQKGLRALLNIFPKNFKAFFEF